ncbi:A-factor biosynthesis hotdog domain protein [Actinomadura rubteroloni]|uniref:A-factor biosynthesis hotdog domain protein n=1 Tax=Actinomadura rubteroloni TaxID=1926885 RepID=A0A2P4UEM0_9ACTN|nr:AfsA-related hotdog domain-containing protein [Actinomadura rubteroloni]POM23507.1 A-factor biosynthesis hotdog domain protein [Actinomadura rubteroloni]
MTDHAVHPASAALGFEATVPPFAVNRRSAAEVFVTDAGRVAPDEFVLAMRVPRGHVLWSDQRGPWHDTVSTVEAFRQAFVLVRHKYLDVPRGTPSGVQRLDLAVEDLDAYRDDGVSPLDGVVQLRVTRPDGRGDTFEITGTYTVGSALAMTLSFSSIMFPRESYEEIRAYQRSRRTAGSAPEVRPVDPASVGRRDPRNVVVGLAPSRPDRFPVVLDRSHPSFFDRDYDHVPGSLLIEALRQSTLLTSANGGGAALTRAALDFTTFVELDAPVECSMSVARGTSPDVVTASAGVEQYGERVAGGTLELTAFP